MCGVVSPIIQRCSHVQQHSLGPPGLTLVTRHSRVPIYQASTDRGQKFNFSKTVKMFSSRKLVNAFSSAEHCASLSLSYILVLYVLFKQLQVLY